ncbi:MAG: SDR family NAD(P)-dependent oxidoreductase [Microthrixaceae bacterium]
MGTTTDGPDATAPVVAVVGASGGLGSEIARSLHRRGAHLVLAGRDRGRLDAVGVPAEAVVALDVRDPTAGDALAAAVLAGPGRLDGYVNAAGVVAFGDLADTEDVVVEELFLTNVIGPIWLLRRVAPLLARTRGTAVHLSAVVADTPLPGMAAYSASKAALTAADRALARELRRQGVRLVDVRPPHTETGLAGRPLAGTAPRLPTGLEPGDVADLVVAELLDGRGTELPPAAFGAGPAGDPGRAPEG